MGDRGVRGNVDLVIIVARTVLPSERRAVPGDMADLPVPVLDSQTRCTQTLAREAVWSTHRRW